MLAKIAVIKGQGNGVKRVEISKLTGSMRPIGIPTVLERLIQQAMAQVAGSDGRAVGVNN